MRSVGSVPTFLAICAAVLLASATFAATSYEARPRCDGVRLRTGPSTSYPTKATIDESSTVTVAAEVSGSSWSTLCGDSTYTGSTWAKVVAVDGVPTTDVYGTKAVYAALGLLRALPAASGATSRPPTTPPTLAPTLAPTPPPTHAPTVEPTGPRSPSPTLAPPASPSMLPTALPATPAPTVPPATAKPSPSGAGTLPIDVVEPRATLGVPGELVLLILSLASMTLAWIAFSNRRHQDRTRRLGAVVPDDRLNDVFE